MIKEKYTSDAEEAAEKKKKLISADTEALLDALDEIIRRL